MLFLGTGFVLAGAGNLVSAVRAELPVRPYFSTALFTLHYRCYDWHVTPPLLRLSAANF